MKLAELRKLSKEVALLTLDISYEARVGHIGSALSISDILTVLYFEVMNLSRANYQKPNRDRFILSKGHAAASLYATLHKKRILTKKQISSFAQDNGLCEHPIIEYPGIEMTTGSLGHGLGYGVGVAYGQKLMGLKARTFVLISDGECNEGSVWEAALLGAHLGLENLVLVVDYNKWQCFGKTEEVVTLEPFINKWTSFGWGVSQVDGHDLSQLKKVFNKLPLKKACPSLVVADTIAGKGISLIENELMAHYKVFNDEEYKKAREDLLGK